MSVANPDRKELRLETAGAGWGLLPPARRFVAGHGEGTIVAWTLGCFAAAWMLFDTVALWPVDVHYDVSEALMWARHFAFGYKHPPLTAWTYALWFAVFPRTDWSVHLQDVTIIVIALAVTWRLLRDHLDKNRTLFGLAALLLIPLYTFKTAELDANAVMMPFWPAALLFYLRARRGLGVLDALFAGAFASLVVLGKYWGFFLMGGMFVASLVGPGTQRFWRSPAPYVMALGAIIVLAPHADWFWTERGGTAYEFLTQSVLVSDSFGAAALKSAYYLAGVAAYAACPLIFLATLRPSRAALRDIAWPADPDRRQALLLFAVPLVLPALANLAVPFRLTPDWSFPNWGLLPVVLYGSRPLTVDEGAVARAGLVALAGTLLVVAASPIFAYARLRPGADAYRYHARQVADLAKNLAGRPLALLWGTPSITGGVPFYLPSAQPLVADPLSEAGRAEIAANGILIVCLSDDLHCQKIAAALDSTGTHTTTATFTRSFLGVSGSPMSFHITVLPPDRSPAPPRS